MIDFLFLDRWGGFSVEDDLSGFNSVESRHEGYEIF